MTFDTLQRDIEAVRAGTLALPALGARLRELPLPPGLPPKFAEVRTDLADRIESSALFSGESCSFSESDLLAAVEAWLEKARARLA